MSDRLKVIKRFLWSLVIFVAGCALGFFGVFVSVFADGGMNERLITIAVILLIYSLLAGLLGFWGPFRSWHWTLLLSSPAMMILLLYSGSEPTLAGYFILYAISIMAVTLLAARAGNHLKGTGKQ